jgi:hypothetical protein
VLYTISLETNLIYRILLQLFCLFSFCLLVVLRVNFQTLYSSHIIVRTDRAAILLLIFYNGYFCPECLFIYIFDDNGDNKKPGFVTWYVTYLPGTAARAALYLYRPYLVLPRVPRCTCTVLCFSLTYPLDLGSVICSLTRRSVRVSAATESHSDRTTYNCRVVFSQ